MRPGKFFLLLLLSLLTITVHTSPHHHYHHHQYHHCYHHQYHHCCQQQWSRYPQRQEWAQMTCLMSFGPLVRLFFFMFLYILTDYLYYIKVLSMFWRHEEALGGLWQLKWAQTCFFLFLFHLYFFFFNNPSVLGPTYEMKWKLRQRKNRPKQCKIRHLGPRWGFFC